MKRTFNPKKKSGPRATVNPAKVKVKEKWQGKIERLAWGAAGVAREADGRLLLISAPLALFPGEEVEAEVEWKARHGEGRLTRWITKDPRRALPECPVAEICGGCDMWGAGAKYAELKQQMVDDLLRRQFQGLSWSWHPAPAEAKRHRIQLHWDGSAFGFHQRKSHKLVSITHCPAAENCLSQAIPRLVEAMKGKLLPIRPQRWELATGTPSGEIFAIAGDGKAWALEPDGWHATQQAITHKHLGLTLKHKAGGFFQVCAPWAMDAFAKVLEKWDLRGGTLYDLYGGVGLFSALLGDRFQQRVLVEADAAAVEWARKNLQAMKLPSECHAVDALEWVVEALGENEDLIVADPPRVGMDPALIEKLKTSGAGKMVLVGCDGAAFCRDVKRLCPEWELVDLAVLDLFPLTAHAEFVGLLEKTVINQ